jgi:hypothetical protein
MFDLTDARSLVVPLGSSLIGCESESVPKAVYTPSVGVILNTNFRTCDWAGRCG